MRMPSKNATSESKTAALRRGPNLQISSDTNAMLDEFVAQHPGVTKAGVVKVALRTYLPDLISGKLLIVNGKMISREELSPV